MINANEVKAALDRAIQSLENSEYDLKGGFILATINRAYYTMFYTMTALLFTEGKYAKTHKGLILQFDELFIKTERFPLITAKWIGKSFDARHKADYDFDSNFEEYQAQILIENAREFLELAKKYITNLEKV